MRYNDEQLFELESDYLNGIKDDFSFSEFCNFAIHRLNSLIEKSTNQSGWMSTDISHLRNYRYRAILFYEQKKGE